MRIGVKYCGGCNPYYDAAAASAHLEMAAGQAFEPYDPSNPPEIAVVLKQCHSDCLSRTDIGGTRGTIWIDEKESLGAASDTLRRLIQEMKQEDESHDE